MLLKFIKKKKRPINLRSNVYCFIMLLVNIKPMHGTRSSIEVNMFKIHMLICFFSGQLFGEGWHKSVDRYRPPFKQITMGKKGHFRNSYTYQILGAFDQVCDFILKNIQNTQKSYFNIKRHICPYRISLFHSMDFACCA